ncbi:unnamed protein product [Gongylonema pulchrum]|uniref:DUF3444 domain-containing protein n=1 Tax=Gongylonema pulchrum TaxID=637853 RepID=A0A183ES76_9BILA|nr:unnamed protein product [Gongylonema pulchrum]
MDLFTPLAVFPVFAQYRLSRSLCSILSSYDQIIFLAISPYDPRHNSTAVYIAETNEIYTGTVSDFAAPNFVASFAYGDHVYFWYREWAAEATDSDRQVIIGII